MIVFAIGVGFAGYTLALYGYSLVRGYNVSLREMISPVNWYQGAWPPPLAPDTVIFPTGGAGGTKPAGDKGSGSGTPAITNYKTGTVAGANPVIVNVAGRGK